MNFEVEYTTNFEKELKRLVKKYHSIKNEISVLIQSLSQNPDQGTSLGHNCFKIRIAISSKGKGKSGGARVLTCLILRKKKVVLLSIYDKSEKESITSSEIKAILNNLEDQ